MKKRFTEDTDPDPVESLRSSDEIPCPVHGQPVEIQVQETKKVGICRCDVPDNKHAGQPVIELALKTKE